MRHRHFKGGTFDPQVKAKKDYAWTVVSCLEKGYVPPAIIGLRLSFCYQPPRAWSNKKKVQAIGRPKLTHPDLSNLIKFTEDALNKLLWEDDRLIVHLEATKIYSEWEGTIIEVYDLGDENEGDV